MSNFLWTLLSLGAYIGGLMIILRATPWLIVRSYDEGLFMGIAALEIIGAILAFSAVVITYTVFSGNLAIKVLDFLFLGGILVVGIRTSLQSLRPRHIKGTFRASRIGAGIFCFSLALAALYYIIQLFR